VQKNQIYLEYNLLGIFLLDETGIVIDERYFPKDSDTIARNIISLDSGVLISNIHELLRNHLEEFDSLKTSHQNLVDSIEKEYSFEVLFDESYQVKRILRTKLPELARKQGFLSETIDFGTLSHNISMRISKKLIRNELSRKETLIPPTVQLLGELDVILNNLSGRLREWYGVHFPELGNRVRDHKEYAQLINTICNRNDFSEDALMRLSFTRKDIDRILDSANSSMGASFDEVDLTLVQGLAKHYLETEKFRERISEYIGMLVEESAPNIAHIAGPVLGGKLIEKAGGLRRLAMMSASTIQVLGAEKAMFRAIKTNAKPPKHGLLFQHPFVHNARRDRRGSRARSLAAKIAIAARADEFSGEFIAENLLAQLKTTE
jgi:nucleolar protein 56